jgi:hypothetical protein
MNGSHIATSACCLALLVACGGEVTTDAPVSETAPAPPSNAPGETPAPPAAAPAAPSSPAAPPADPCAGTFVCTGFDDAVKPLGGFTSYDYDASFLSFVTSPRSGPYALQLAYGDGAMITIGHPLPPIDLDKTGVRLRVSFNASEDTRAGLGVGQRFNIVNVCGVTLSLDATDAGGFSSSVKGNLTFQPTMATGPTIGANAWHEFVFETGKGSDEKVPVTKMSIDGVDIDGALLVRHECGEALFLGSGSSSTFAPRTIAFDDVRLEPIVL